MLDGVSCICSYPIPAPPHCFPDRQWPRIRQPNLSPTSVKSWRRVPAFLPIHFFPKRKEMYSQWPVVLASPINQIFLMHLHCLIVIFILSHYYIYNDFFSVIYWKEWCNLRITQIYTKFFKKIYKLFLWIPDIIEIYIKLFTNSSEIKKNKIHTRRWERRDCRRVFRARVRVSGRDTGTGMIACLTLKPSGRTHRDASHARSRQHDRRRGEADASASHGPKNDW